LLLNSFSTSTSSRMDHGSKDIRSHICATLLARSSCLGRLLQYMEMTTKPDCERNVAYFEIGASGEIRTLTPVSKTGCYSNSHTLAHYLWSQQTLLVARWVMNRIPVGKGRGPEVLAPLHSELLGKFFARKTQPL